MTNTKQLKHHSRLNHTAALPSNNKNIREKRNNNIQPSTCPTKNTHHSHKLPIKVQTSNTPNYLFTLGNTHTHNKRRKNQKSHPSTGSLSNRKMQLGDRLLQKNYSHKTGPGPRHYNPNRPKQLLHPPYEKAVSAYHYYYFCWCFRNYSSGWFASCCPCSCRLVRICRCSSACTFPTFCYCYVGTCETEVGIGSYTSGAHVTDRFLGDVPS
ncbi:Rho GTPase activation protein (RhoGAP) with PHdomain, partial [Striga asiatica]